MEIDIINLLGKHQIEQMIVGDLYHYTSITSLKSIIESGSF